MEIRPLLRPLSSSSSRTLSGLMTTTTAAATAMAARRQQSTTSRTKKRLNIAPHLSFLGPGPSSGGANHIVFNPPAAAPSVYHTPFKFLPKSDPRRRGSLAQQVLLRGSTSASAPDPPLPPTLTPDERARAQPNHNVTREQVDEMRGLRAADPERWSVVRLAARYGCSKWFVMMCCRSSPEHRERERARKEAIRARWGPVRTQAREERKKRKALLLRDEL